jgi:hypothetical protein
LFRKEKVFSSRKRSCSERTRSCIPGTGVSRRRRGPCPRPLPYLYVLNEPRTEEFMGVESTPGGYRPDRWRCL